MAEELTSVAPLLPLLERRPLGLFCDIDGTLAPIVPNPEEAQVTPEARRRLAQLTAAGVRVALVTGRAVEMARRIAPVEGAVIVGNHGLNLFIDGAVETPEAAREYVLLAQAALAELSRRLLPGVVVEDKGPVLALHFRTAPDEEAARHAILEAIAASEAARRFTVYEGRKVIELRPPLAVDKGTAVVRLAERLGLGAALALGDDITDVDMFRGVEELKQRGLAGASVAVWSEEANPMLLEVTDYFVKGVGGVVWLLGEMAAALSAKRP